jgi:two-component system nitrate/nitrite response regulator NarL
MVSDERPIRLIVQCAERQTRRTLVDHLTAQRGLEVVGDTATLGGLGALCALHRPDACVVEECSPALDHMRNAFPGIYFIASRSTVDPTAGVGTVAALSARERSVVSLMGAGRSVADMARLLDISPHTVGNHKRGIYAKFGVGNQSHAVSRALSLGLVGDGSGDTWTPRPDPGRPFVVMVRGPAGGCLDEVIVALLEGQIPFAAGRSPHSLSHDHWASWHRGGVVSVLVDPDRDAWQEAVSAVVVHSTPPELAQTMDAVLHGACAVLSRADVGADLCDVLALVARGYGALNSSHVRVLATWVSALLSRPCPTVFDLTGRERDILASIACGHTVRQTAQSLGIATKTVENTQTRLFRKLGTHNRSETIVAAYRLGMITK